MNSEEANIFNQAWEARQNTFIIYSSGSTGKPKPIVLERKWMEWSAVQTAKYLKPKKGEKLFCCIPVNRVGGLMVLVRSKVWGLECITTEAIANPLLEKVDADIISITPYQLYYIINNPVSRENIKRFREILIGGAEIPIAVENQIQSFDESSIFRHSYGMTETYSHIALRTLNGNERSDVFHAFDSIEITLSKENTGIFKTPFYTEPLKTNDVLELHPNNRFKVLGRSDFIINSGGVKLMPEQIEYEINKNLNPLQRFIISAQKDEALGEKLVLVYEGKSSEFFNNLEFLKQINPYAVPKSTIAIFEFPTNEGGKIDRLKIKEIINK